MVPHGGCWALSKHCVCYTTDDGYLLPTLISALQARDHVGAKDGVVICHIGERGRKAEIVNEACRDAKVEFISVSAQTIGGRHVMFARMFLDLILPADYDSVLYVDGDTQVTGSLQPLLDAPLAAGELLAAPDPMVLMLDNRAPEWGRLRSYFSSIGLSQDRRDLYFNSGVLRFGRNDLGEIRSDCLKLLEIERPPLRFPDQDILNIACAERVRQMSFRWNFPIFFLNCGFRAAIEPKLFHFMSNPRPWHGPLRPWGEEFSAVYARLTAGRPEFAEMLPRLPRWKLAKYWMQQHVKAYVESATWNTPAMHEKLRALEARALV